MQEIKKPTMAWGYYQTFQLNEDINGVSKTQVAPHDKFFFHLAEFE
jgi:hypothetical protein